LLFENRRILLERISGGLIALCCGSLSFLGI
jgi:hypothetical protein